MPDSNAALPKTDRELLLKVSDRLERLADSLDTFGERMGAIEMKRIDPLELRVTSLEKWKNEISGGWKVVLVVITILTLLNSITTFIKIING